jgi:adenylate cyclase
MTLKIAAMGRTALAALMGGSVALLFGLLHLAGLLAPLERMAYDVRFRALARPELASRDVVVIALDNPSFESADMREEYGRWPWRRQLYAQALYYLRQAGARAVAVDITFAGADPHSGDDRLLASQLGVKSDTVLAFSFTELSGAAAVRDAALDRNEWKVENGACGPQREYTGLDLPLAELSEKARGLGSTTAFRDPDSVLRHAPLLFRYGQGFYPSLALAVTGPGPERAAGRRAAFRCSTPFRSGAAVLGGREIPLDRSGEALVYWYGHQPGTGYSFRHFPVYQITNSAKDLFQGKPPEVPLAEFKDKYVVIGPSAVGIGDFHASPMAATVPGVEYQATLISNLLQGHFVTPAPGALNVLAILLLALGTSLAVWRFADWRAYTGASLALAALFVAGNFAWFHTARTALVLAAPLGALATAFAAGNLTRYITEGREKRRYRATLMKYVSPPLVEAMMRDPGLGELHNQKIELTVLFSDVRGFTTISEKIPVDELVKTLNEFLSAMVEVIFRNGGTLDKFVGDCVMAFWGAPVRQEDHAARCARTALEMIATLEVLNAGWRKQGRQELHIGVGINTGEMILGNIGSERRMDFTVIGDNVNLAARLESSTKELKASIVISEATYRQIERQAQVRDLGTIHVKGKDVPIRVYELLGMAGKENVIYESAPTSS